MVLTAVLITGMIGMLALSIDLGFLFSNKNQFQNGIDAGTLAGATGLRSSIEADTGMPQQSSIVKALAVQYAGFNQVRRYSDPVPDSGIPNSNNIALSANDVTVDLSLDIPQVKVNTFLETPLLFAGIFGFGSMNINAVSTASLFPVDGGTGSIGGCWRPIFLPDTYYDSANLVHVVGDPARGSFPLPNQNGDYYRSRFAAGGRNMAPYVDGLTSIGFSTTGLRDTQDVSEVGTQTIMGQFVEFSRNNYRIADLSGLPRATFDTLSAGDLANFGYCGQIRVGDLLPVFDPALLATYEQVRFGLNSLKTRTNDLVDNNLKLQYRYIKSASYQAPNSHAAIIPVLLFNPVDLVRSPGSTSIRVTNIGLFWLEEVRPDGTLYGFFVREIITGGTPIDATNFTSNSPPTFVRSWLPMSTQLLR